MNKGDKTIVRKQSKPTKRGKSALKVGKSNPPAKSEPLKRRPAAKSRTTAVKRARALKDLTEDADPGQCESSGGTEADSEFPVVGIGASAGGLEALEMLLTNLASEPGMAFVVVTHKHPDHVSLLPELLGRCTPMSIIEVKGRTEVKPNVVYLSPASESLTIDEGHLDVTAPMVASGVYLPIDQFFRSLAADRKDRAIGIVLSGTGSDGTLGVVAIKGAGGFVMAQDEHSAKYSSMPVSAATATTADCVAPPRELAHALVAYAKGIASKDGNRRTQRAPANVSETWRRAFVLLHNRCGHDFSSYKASTVQRRFERRMVVHQIDGITGYVRFLEQNPHELDILFKELLIEVTSFFRDPESWDVLKDALASTLGTRDTTAPFRVWIAGCSTGEEAYTFGIVAREAMEAAGRPARVQIFATDIDPDVIEVARTGRYADGIAADITPERLSRYFKKEDGGFRINKDIREMIAFAPHNVIKDPPFTKLNALTCRNLLIYLEQDVQRRLLALFHYALQDDGLLLLGPSETTSGASDLFSVVDKRWRLFRRHAGFNDAYRARGVLPDLPPLSSDVSRHANVRDKLPRVATTAERVLMTRFVPPSLIITAHGDIVYIHGRTGLYLEPAQGEPTSNAFSMAREGLRLELPSAVRQAATRDEPVVRSGIPIKTNGSIQKSQLSVLKLHDPESVRGLFLVTLGPDPNPSPARRSKKRRESIDGDDQRAVQLERELERKQDNLQGIIEELETSNEELKSTNEELQSTNEELQSANEELETSKEEMQSLNEELQTVNAELQSKMDELSRANDDMQNLLNSTDIATIFLDNNLCIKRFTESARSVLPIIDTDVGRPIGDLVHHLQYDHLVTDAKDVLRTLEHKEQEVLTKDGAWRLMRIVPYRTADNVIDGLVITLVDIDRIKQTLREASAAHLFVALSRSGLAVLDRTFRILSANDRFCRLFDLQQRDVEGRSFFEMDGGWDSAQLRKRLNLVADGECDDADIEVTCSGARFRLSAYRIPNSPGEVGIVLAPDSRGSIGSKGASSDAEEPS